MFLNAGFRLFDVLRRCTRCTQAIEIASDKRLRRAFEVAGAPGNVIMLGFRYCHSCGCIGIVIRNLSFGLPLLNNMVDVEAIAHVRPCTQILDRRYLIGAHCRHTKLERKKRVVVGLFVQANPLQSVLHCKLASCPSTPTHTMGLQGAYANMDRDQDRDNVNHSYQDVMSSLSGKKSYHSESPRLLCMRCQPRKARSDGCRPD